MTETAIGVDIGGTNTSFGIITKNGECIAENSIPTKGYKNVKKYVEYLSQSIKILFNNYSDKYNIKGIGIGAPNGNFYKGTVELAPNLDWGDIVPLADMIEKHFKKPVWLTNDANAAALGEKLFGGAKKMNDFLFITLGTGLGSGIVSNGNLLYGHDGFAGELGHTIVVKDGRECGCKRKGCLETYVSASGIKRTVYQLIAELHHTSELRNISFNELESKKIFEEARKGDKIALKAFDITADFLGKSLANAVAFTSPEAIFLFGGLANAGDLLFVPVRKYFEYNLQAIYKNKITILPSQLKNGQAAILGAAALVWSNK